MDSGYFGAGVLVGLLVGLLVACVIGTLVGGWLLRLSVQWMEQFTPGYGRTCLVAFLSMLLGGIANVVAAVLLRMGMAGTGWVAGANLPGAGLMIVATLFGLALGVAIVAALAQWLVRRPDGSALGFDRAAVVAGVYVGLCFALYVVVVGACLLLVGGVPGVSR
jgi:hypothetical protein